MIARWKKTEDKFPQPLSFSRKSPWFIPLLHVWILQHFANTELCLQHRAQLFWTDIYCRYIFLAVWFGQSTAQNFVMYSSTGINHHASNLLLCDGALCGQTFFYCLSAITWKNLLWMQMHGVAMHLHSKQHGSLPPNCHIDLSFVLRLQLNWNPFHCFLRSHEVVRLALSICFQNVQHNEWSNQH